ncbi:conserved protein of unknown function [Nitrospira japonica]|uniref:Uncharacterized protein n=1 Tax=Nitrospira japonica TaxID=1325564 RepID=A0A1W1I4Y5_9BACT|nr:hypothetical protein [Nitrospira japonica]SLM47949.1 conserved protein of unknown function [Nitrospira japonica]
MSQCLYCKQRKGKRSCPALGGLICPLCCGEHRIVRIACPQDCDYLESGSDYQQKRLGEHFMPLRREFYRQLADFGGEKAVALYNLVEVVTFSYFQDRRDGQDAEIITAIQALRRTLSPLHVPSAPMPIFAEHLKKEYDSFKKQNPQQIADATLAPEVLDRSIRFVSEFSGAGFQSQRFLAGLVGYVRAYHPEIAAHLTKQHEAGRIVLPNQSFAPPSPEPHVHGPGCEHHHH